MKKILVIQTSFIGDVILATALLEKLHKAFPDAEISFMLRKGNEALLANHPFLKNLFVWDKARKWSSFFEILRTVRREKFDLLINLQRFATTGIFTLLSGAKEKRGFAKNPFSLFFDKKFPHEYRKNWHETDRNQMLIVDLTDTKADKPRLYPSENDFQSVAELKTEKYICFAPTSVWYTKQLPAEKWVELAEKLNFEGKIYLLGAKSDFEACQSIARKCGNAVVLAGKLNLLQSAALMRDAEMNYVNDSSPMHLASAVNANTAAFFCSTVPDFGFFPLSDVSFVLQYEKPLPCRPCNLHGKKSCPEGHFLCGKGISFEAVVMKNQSEN
jgi:heptosyltransferase-2